MDAGTLLTAASIVGALGTSVLVFRLQRELQVAENGGHTWIPWADRLIIAAISLSFLVVVVLLISRSPTIIGLASAVVASAAVLGAGYPFAVLAHYRFLRPPINKPQRTNPEGVERHIVIICAVVAVLVALCRILLV